MSFLRNVGAVDDGPVTRRILPGGMRFLSERVDNVPSLALGIWVCAGSLHDGPEHAGIAHMLEHVVFKGTRRLSSLQIAKKIESLGGQVDAFTTKETTCYHARVFEGNLRETVKMLGEILSGAAFRADQIARERQVVIEEILGYDDSPEELAFDLASELIWQGHPLGSSILGTQATVNKMGARDLRAFHREHYVLSNVVVTAAGRFDADRLEHDLLRYLRLPEAEAGRNGTRPRLGRAGASRSFNPSAARANGRSAARTHARPSGRPAVRMSPYRQRVRHLDRDISQTSICLMRRAASAHDRRRHAQAVLHTILGAGVSSRLFQRIREEDALAYTVYTYLDTLLDSGLFSIYLSVDPGQTRRSLRQVGRELRRVRRHGVKKWEVESAKAQILTGVFLSYESMYERMSRLAMDEIYYGRDVPMAEVIRSVDAVTIDQVNEEAQRLLDPSKYSLVTIGPKGHERPELSDIDF